MSDLIHQGKILYWGTSEWDAAQVSQAIGTAAVRADPANRGAAAVRNMFTAAA